MIADINSAIVPDESPAGYVFFSKIRKWANDRGLYSSGDAKSQTIKLGEEYGELCAGIVKNKPEEVKDAIGDMIVVLTSVAHLSGFTIEECIESAYNEIANRKGKMDNGTFIKA